MATVLPGRVTDVTLDGDTRVLTMPGGYRIRELILGLDHDARRLAYSVVEGQHLPLTYHHATFEVAADGDRARLTWTTDLLPHGLAQAVRERVARGIVEIRDTLEGTARRG
jgi:hypothetical protein